MSRLLRQALDALHQKISEGLEYPDAHTFVVTTLGLSDEQAGDLAQAYDNQAEHRGCDNDKLNDALERSLPMRLLDK